MRGGPNVAMNTSRACNHATLKACRGVEPRHRRHEILDERMGRMDATIEANFASCHLEPHAIPCFPRLMSGELSAENIDIAR